MGQRENNLLERYRSRIQAAINKRGIVATLSIDELPSGDFRIMVTDYRGSVVASHVDETFELALQRLAADYESGQIVIPAPPAASMSTP